jgi:hypothetical protein
VAAAEDEFGEAYAALSAADSAVLVGLERELLALIDEGAPAAIVYAALLLRRTDRHDPHALLRRYAQDERLCLVYPGGCAALPMNNLGEVVRWVGGVPWVPPSQRVRDRLARVAAAEWFELPTAELLRRVRSAVTDHDRADERDCTIAFADLLAAPDCAPELPAHRAALESLLRSSTPAVCVYAALLLRSIERRSGDEALEALARSGMTVRRSPRLFGLVHRSTPIEVLAAELRSWSAFPTQ